MRAVDYLYTLPEVDKQKIGITGHSRNGKQALLAAAFDERIAAVVPSSGNTGECDPWRYTTDMFANESIEQITGAFPHWFHPRLRFFAGREHKLPVDQNMLMALVAPRGLMMYSGYAESEGGPVGLRTGLPLGAARVPLAGPRREHLAAPARRRALRPPPPTSRTSSISSIRCSGARPARSRRPGPTATHLRTGGRSRANKSTR